LINSIGSHCLTCEVKIYRIVKHILSISPYVSFCKLRWPRNYPIGSTYVLLLSATWDLNYGAARKTLSFDAVNAISADKMKVQQKAKSIQPDSYSFHI